MDDVIYTETGGVLRQLPAADFLLEDDLQRLVAEHPSLLAGAQMDPANPRRFILVRREAPVPDRERGGQRWSVDHLFVDQDAIPTLVEAKRATNTQVRREVVGQMLDYASNAARFWSGDELRRSFTVTHGDTMAHERLAELVGDHTDPDGFWRDVETNLSEGRMRLVFLSDRIPTELQSIVEFLNERTDPTEVLAIELRQFTGQDDLRVLVPRVIGATAAARRAKRTGPGYDAILENASEEARAVDTQLRGWASKNDVQIEETGRGLRFQTREGIHLFYAHPGPAEIQFTMKSIRERAPERADELTGGFAELSSKPLTAKHPILLMSDVVQRWDEFEETLRSYVRARRQHSTRAT